RGPRRKRTPKESRLLACPRLAPDWEFSALAALIKPQLKSAIMHRSGDQPWTEEHTQAVREVSEVIGQRLGFRPVIYLAHAGDYHFAMKYSPDQEAEAIAFAKTLSIKLRDLWFVAGRYFVKDGAFFRRGRGYRFPLIPAGEVH